MVTSRIITMPHRDPFHLTGHTLDGQFFIEDVAGEGSFGVVYRARHLGLDVPVAVKCLKIPDDLPEDQRRELVAAFRLEAQLLHRLSRRSAGIVQVLDVGAATAPAGPWTPYLVMEWLDGCSLEDDLRKRRAEGLGARSVDEAIELLSPAIAALAVAHEENVSHRDVKPGNIFLERSRGAPLVKIVDFGIAKVFEETPTLSDALIQTGKGSRMFTPRYGAPEQFDPSYGATGPWTDVYALGLLLVELASGQPALPGSNLVQIHIAASDERSRPSLRARGIAVDAAIDAVVLRAVAVRPVFRYRSAGDLLEALQSARRAGSGVSGHSPAAGTPREPAAAQRPPGVAESEQDWLGSSGFGENRVCTVMCIDLSPVGERGGHRDPEELKERLDRCLEIIRAEVEALGGMVEASLGDRVIAVFGVPRVSESDAERATLAALRIQATLGSAARARAPRGARPSTRIGIATGRVFAERGTGRGRAITVTGDPVNMAIQLQQSAPPGAVVVGTDTHRQIAGAFQTERLAAASGTFGAVGERAEGPRFRVLGAAASRAAPTASDFLGLGTKFVGRAAERQRLMDALETIRCERQARLITVVGPPGVGRSRLLLELASTLSAAPEDQVVLTVQCSPLGRSQSYGLVSALLRAQFAIEDQDDAAAVLRKLRRGVRLLRLRLAGGEAAASTSMRRSRAALARDERERREALEDAIRVLATILPGAHAATAPDALPSDEAGRMTKQRISAAVARLAALVTAHRPLVLLCDDVQWADDASLDLLEHFARRLEQQPLLVVCAARPELYEHRPAWDRGPQRERIELAPLPRRHIEEMLRDRLRCVPALSAESVRRLAERAEGSPLCAVEMLHLLVDMGVLEVRSAAWELREDRLDGLSLPATVQRLVQARLDQLDARARLVIAQAAVVGRTFWEGAVEALQRAVPRPAAAEPLRETLGRLSDRQHIRAREPPSIAGEREHSFAEAATHEVASELLSARVRRPLHVLTAEWLEERAGGGVSAALVALHYDLGGDARRAAAAYASAGAQAAALGENAEALRHFTRAAELHDEGAGADAEDGRERRIAGWRERARVFLDMGDVRRRMGQLDLAEVDYAAARARILGQERRAGAALDPKEAPRWEARIDHRLALLCKVAGRLEQARSLAERAIAMANEGDAAEETPAMYALVAFVERRMGRPEQSFRAARQGLTVIRASMRDGARRRSEAAQLLFGLAAAQNARGRMVRVERLYRQAARLISEDADPCSAGVAWNGVAGARLALGDARGARDALLRSLRLKERAGDLYQLAVAYNNLAEIELSLGEHAAALRHARLGVELCEQAGAGSDLGDMYRNLAEASLAMGALDAALEAASRALASAEGAGRLYFGAVAVTVARVCARARQATADGSAPSPRAREAAERLSAALGAITGENERRSA